MFGVGQSEGFVGLFVLIVIYFIPAAVAHRRGHKNAGGITLLNLLLGWTLLVWVVCFIWAFSDRQPYKQCPYCASSIPATVRRCKFCGEELTPTVLYKKCKDCGASIPDLATKCPYCKKWLETPVATGVGAGATERLCSTCGTRNPAANRICMNCGEEMSTVITTQDSEWICYDCLTRNLSNRRECVQCGRSANSKMNLRLEQ